MNILKVVRFANLTLPDRDRLLPWTMTLGSTTTMMWKTRPQHIVVVVSVVAVEPESKKRRAQGEHGGRIRGTRVVGKPWTRFVSL